MRVGEAILRLTILGEVEWKERTGRKELLREEMLEVCFEQVHRRPRRKSVRGAVFV